MNNSLKNSDVWEIVFEKSHYETFRNLGVFEDKTRVNGSKIQFNDEEKKIIFPGRLTSYYNWMEGVFNFRVGSEEKWLRVFRSGIETINGVLIDEIVKYKEVVYEIKKTIPDMPGWIEVSGW